MYKVHVYESTGTQTAQILYYTHTVAHDYDGDEFILYELHDLTHTHTHTTRTNKPAMRNARLRLC